MSENFKKPKPKSNIFRRKPQIKHTIKKHSAPKRLALELPSLRKLFLSTPIDGTFKYITPSRTITIKRTGKKTFEIIKPVIDNATNADDTDTDTDTDKTESLGGRRYTKRHTRRK
jgi:hypothetical protein